MDPDDHDGGVEAMKKQEKKRIEGRSDEGMAHVLFQDLGGDSQNMTNVYGACTPPPP